MAYFVSAINTSNGEYEEHKFQYPETATEMYGFLLQFTALYEHVTLTENGVKLSVQEIAQLPTLPDLQ